MRRISTMCRHNYLLKTLVFIIEKADEVQHLHAALTSKILCECLNFVKHDILYVIVVRKLHKLSEDTVFVSAAAIIVLLVVVYDRLANCLNARI